MRTGNHRAPLLASHHQQLLRQMRTVRQHNRPHPVLQRPPVNLRSVPHHQHQLPTRKLMQPHVHRLLTRRTHRQHKILLHLQLGPAVNMRLQSPRNVRQVRPHPPRMQPIRHVVQQQLQQILHTRNPYHLPSLVHHRYTPDVRLLHPLINIQKRLVRPRLHHIRPTNHLRRRPQIHDQLRRLQPSLLQHPPRPRIQSPAARRLRIRIPRPLQQLRIPNR